MDWSGMPRELLAIIAQNHIVSYEDYYSFAGVCKSWRLAAKRAAKNHKFPNGPPSRFPSLMLAQKTKGNNEFRELLLLSNQSILKKSIRKIRLPQVHDKVYVTSCGWLVTVGEDFSSQLINPLSCQTINLPKVNTFYRYDDDPRWYVGIQKLILLTNNNHSSYVSPLVVVLWGYGRSLGFCQPGDSKWTRVEKCARIWDFTYYNGKVYCLGQDYSWGGLHKNYVYEWDHTKDQTALVEISSAMPDNKDRCDLVTYLIGVDDGERKRLLVVIREGKRFIRTYRTKRFLVFSYDLEKGEWTEVKDLGTKALFVGRVSFSIDQDTTGAIKGNSIYFTDDACFRYGSRANVKTRDMGIYHLSDGTIEPYFNKVSPISRITPPMWLQSM